MQVCACVPLHEIFEEQNFCEFHELDSIRENFFKKILNCLSNQCDSMAFCKNIFRKKFAFWPIHENYGP